jgi:Ca2+-binding RTX toxin-like protein
VNAKGGDDELKVTGVQQWQQVDFDGGQGNDRYSIWSKNANLYVSDSGGYDWLDYSWVFSSAYVELDKSNGEYQYTGANTLRLWGDIEGLKGSYHDDRLYGNALANVIDGQSGNDVIFGRAGDDTLIGNWGNDQVYGNEGNDQIWTGDGDDIGLGGTGNDSLYGGNGRDVLIGGYGSDYLIGEAGDDLLIGGATAFDGNEAALWAILAEWTSSRTRLQRQLNLQYGTGSATRLNQSYFLRTGAGGTIYDDAAVDVLIKGPDDAWTFPQGSDQVRSS